MKELMYTWHVYKIAQDDRRRDMHVGRVQASCYKDALKAAKRVYGKSCDYIEQGNEVR